MIYSSNVPLGRDINNTMSYKTEIYDCYVWVSCFTKNAPVYKNAIRELIRAFYISILYTVEREIFEG